MSADAERRIGPTAAREAAAPFDGGPRGRALQAMAAIVAEGGYRDVTAQRIVARASIDWPTFVELFGDVDGCFLATLDAGHACAAERAREAVAPLGPGATRREALGPMLDAVLGAAAENPDLTRLCLVEAPVLGVRAVRRREAALQRFVDMLDGLPGDAGLASEMVVGGIYEIVQRRAREAPIERLPELAGELRRLWLPALSEA